MALLNNQRVPGKPHLIEKIRCTMAFGVFYFRIKPFTFMYLWCGLGQTCFLQKEEEREGGKGVSEVWGCFLNSKWVSLRNRYGNRYFLFRLKSVYSTYKTTWDLDIMHICRYRWVPIATVCVWCTWHTFQTLWRALRLLPSMTSSI
jgi:hypothetical protein